MEGLDARMTGKMGSGVASALGPHPTFGCIYRSRQDDFACDYYCTSVHTTLLDSLQYALGDDMISIMVMVVLWVTNERTAMKQPFYAHVRLN